MGSLQTTMAQTVSLDAYSILKPFMELIEDPDTRENVEETARIYFTGTGVPVNLIPSLIIGLLLLIGLLKLLGLPILASFGLDGLTGGGDSGYGAPSGGYGTPSTGYGSPSSGYDAYARGDYFDSTVADLQEQINQLVASNEALTNQVYYGATGSSTSLGSSIASNLIGSS